MIAPDDSPVLRIHPNPSDAELAAITVAVALLRQADRADRDGEIAILVSKWLRAGRLESVGLSRNARDPWRPRV